MADKEYSQKMNLLEFLNSPIILFLIVAIPLLVGFAKKRKFFATIFVPAELSTYLAQRLIKMVTANPRPFFLRPEVLGVTTHIPQDYSFPSGHTAVATLFAWILTFVYPQLSWVWFAILAVIATSRVKLGLHYPQDVFGGFVLSSLIFWSIYLFARRKKTLRWKENPNIRRKVIHLFYGFILAFLVDYELIKLNYFFLWLIFSLAVVVTSPILPPFLRKIVNYFEREKDKRFLAQGPFLFTLGAFFSWIIFPKDIALIAILNLAIGDSVNALAGTFLKGKRKKIEAAAAAFFATLVISSQYLPFKTALAGSLVTMIFEFSEPKINGKKIDDNLLIPVLSGVAMTLTYSLMTH